MRNGTNKPTKTPMNGLRTANQNDASQPEPVMILDFVITASV